VANRHLGPTLQRTDSSDNAPFPLGCMVAMLYLQFPERSFSAMLSVPDVRFIAGTSGLTLVALWNRRHLEHTLEMFRRIGIRVSPLPTGPKNLVSRCPKYRSSNWARAAASFSTYSRRKINLAFVSCFLLTGSLLSTRSLLVLILSLYRWAAECLQPYPRSVAKRSSARSCRSLKGPTEGQQGPIKHA
jgi:hypothetical protein